MRKAATAAPAAGQANARGTVGQGPRDVGGIRDEDELGLVIAAMTAWYSAAWAMAWVSWSSWSSL
jgi:hypothetical protein